MQLRGVLATTAASIATIGVLSGCAGTKTVTEHAPEVAETTITTSTAQVPAKPHRAKVALNNPAQPPDQSTTVACDEAAMGHACRATTTSPSDPNEFRQRNSDTNIVANSAASCGLAENAFYEYYRSGQAEDESIMVHSHASNKDYELFCHREAGLIGCTGSPLSTGIYTSFPIKAVRAYTPAQAAAYGKTRDVGHPGVPAARRAQRNEEPSPESYEPEPKSQPEEEPNSHAEDKRFCSTHECIGKYHEEPGTVVECEDGSFSHAGGIQGACSHHGGVR
jgi:hypothetical protein